MLTTQRKKRTQISKKLRFDVFKRDLFTCKYCGQTPPSVILEVDHIVPVSKDGLTEIDNLLTSCFDCNRGKSDRELIALPETTEQKNLILLEKKEQYEEYKKLMTDIDSLIETDVQRIAEVFCLFHPEYELSNSFKVSVKNFIKKLGYEVVKEAMEKSCSKFIYNSQTSLKYFCGVCWNRIKNPNNG